MLQAAPAPSFGAPLAAPASEKPPDSWAAVRWGPGRVASQRCNPRVKERKKKGPHRPRSVRLVGVDDRVDAPGQQNPNRLVLPPVPPRVTEHESPLLRRTSYSPGRRRVDVGPCVAHQPVV